LAIIGNGASPGVIVEMREVQATARTLGLDVNTREIKKAEDIAPAIEALKGRAGALYFATDPLLFTNRIRINTLALGVQLPTIYGSREYVESGGLMSYGANFADLFRRAGDYVDKILRGTKPTDIPIEPPIKFDLVVVLTTARTLGLKIGEAFLLRCDELIE
jgi:putative ABC transport system substrate-binding protein